MASRRGGRPASSVRALDVRVGGVLAGTLVHLGNEDVVFAFDSHYVDAVDDRPTLSLSFKAADGGLLQRTRPTHVRLEPFFSNLLPEAHLRQYLAARGRVHPNREFFLLWLLGADLPGAIEVTAADGAPVTPPPDAADPASPRPAPLRFSLAGVQLKFSAVAETSGGLTLPASGVGGDWIVKLPSPRFGHVPENEFAMLTLARAAGIDVPDVRLVDTGSVEGLPPHLPETFGRSLAIRRFDRPYQGPRVHMEDFAQVFGVYPERKYHRASYANIARVVWLETGEAGIVEFTRRLVFNVLIGNGDAHLKNWSLFYPDGRTTRLAPAYDLISTVAYLPDDSLALSLGGTKAFAEIDLDRIERFAEQAGLPVRMVLKVARETTERVRDLLPSHEPLRALPDQMRDRIVAHAASMMPVQS